MRRRSTHTQPQTYLEWRSHLQRRQQRRDAVELFGITLAVEVLLFTVYVQFRRGVLADLAIASAGQRVTVVLAVSVLLALLISPVRCGRIIGRFVHVPGSFVIDLITTVALGVVYVVTLPFATLLGRRAYVRRHPHGAAWVSRRHAWRGSTWRVKHIAVETRGGRGALWRLVGYFVAQRNVVLLLITLVILLAVSLSVLSQSTYLAPFVYTLF